MFDKLLSRVDPFAPNPPPCPYAAESDCPLAKEGSRGLGHLSMTTLGECGECPGHNEFDKWGATYFQTVSRACRPTRN
jgi:hypothetical protein